jgi:hypothetical protein
MTERLSRQYKLKKLEIKLSKETKDIRELVADFQYHEAIEAPFIRCDFTILDAADFNKSLQGGEEITVELETDSSKGQSLKFTNKIWKIGSIIKSERGQMYILHTVSPEMFGNELNKVFDAFGPESKNDKDNIPLFICKDWLLAKSPSNKIKSENFESHSKITFISPSWKPVDAIAYMSDKVTRKGASKGSQSQSGYLFFENKRGFQFRSIDGLAEGKASKAQNLTYTYIQQGSAPKDNGYYVIESIQYPDKVDHLKAMRLGTYKSIAIGISITEPTNNRLTNSGTSGKNAPGGVIYPPKVIEFGEVFKRASKIEELPPYVVPKEIMPDNASPTRQKIRILPGYKNQQELGKSQGTDSDLDTMAVAEYAAARYNLLKTIQLTIVIPGNTALTVGDIITVKIPASQEEGKRVKEDAKYSGKYLIAALSHTFKREGLTTKLVLIRDSIKKANY